MAKKHSAGHGHKHAPRAKRGGGNLKLPNPSQAMHVAPKKDDMDRNIGGSEHMGQKMDLGHEDLINTGGAQKGPKKYHDAY